MAPQGVLSCQSSAQQHATTGAQMVSAEMVRRRLRNSGVSTRNCVLSRGPVSLSSSTERRQTRARALQMRRCVQPRLWRHLEALGSGVSCSRRLSTAPHAAQPLTHASPPPVDTLELVRHRRYGTHVSLPRVVALSLACTGQATGAERREPATSRGVDQAYLRCSHRRA
jgi:hypothetical protein